MKIYEKHKNNLANLVSLRFFYEKTLQRKEKQVHCRNSPPRSDCSSS